MKIINIKGFTFIEAVIVAAMVAILAAVAMPLYNGYIQSTKQDTVNSLAETVATAANAYYRKTGSTLSSADINSKLNIYYDSTKYEVKIDNGNAKNIVVNLVGSSPLITKSIPYR